MTLRALDRRRIGIHVVGWSFVLAGLAGLVLPVLPGLLFLAVGLILLSTVSARIRLGRQRLGRRFPILRRGLGEAEGWMDRRGWRRRTRRRSGRTPPSISD